MLKKYIVRALSLYMAASLAASLLYNLCPSAAWDIASHRHGLVIVSFDKSGVWLLNPFSCAADDWLFCIGGCSNAD